MCLGSKECKVHVQLVHDTTEVFLSTCSVVFETGISSHTIAVYAKRDFIDDGDKLVTIQIAVVEGSNAADWNSHEKIQDIQVRYDKNYFF